MAAAAAGARGHTSPRDIVPQGGGSRGTSHGASGPACSGAAPSELGAGSAPGSGCAPGGRAGARYGCSTTSRNDFTPRGVLRKIVPVIAGTPAARSSITRATTRLRSATGTPSTWVSRSPGAQPMPKPAPSKISMPAGSRPVGARAIPRGTTSASARPSTVSAGRRTASGGTGASGVPGLDGRGAGTCAAEPAGGGPSASESGGRGAAPASSQNESNEDAKARAAGRGPGGAHTANTRAAPVACPRIQATDQERPKPIAPASRTHSPPSRHAAFIPGAIAKTKPATRSGTGRRNPPAASPAMIAACHLEN